MNGRKRSLVRLYFDGGLNCETDSRTGSHLKGEHFLNVLYILTNDKSEWLDDFIHQLQNSHGWKIITSHDIVFGNSQEKDVGMAVDMDLARRSAMFMGNGVSLACLLPGG